MSKLLGRKGHKARWYGRELVCVDTFYPSSKTCFDCGTVTQNLRLAKSWWCPSCVVVHDRNPNAGRNLHIVALLAGRRDVTLLDGKALAAGWTSGTTGPDEAGTPPVPAVAGI